LAHIGREGGDVNKSRHFGIIASFRDDDASIRVPHEDDRAIFKRDRTHHRRHILFRDVNGSWTAVTRSPPSSRSGMTFDHDEPSAHAPCTRITFEAVVILFLPFLPPTIETMRRRAYRPSVHPTSIRPPIEPRDRMP
jgi:hypothetical protein